MMDRRKFLRDVTAATAIGAVANMDVASADDKPKESRSVTYQVKGFTCVTCAVGLEVMLRGLRGVARANASYPAGNVVVGFDEQLTTEKTLREFIVACGFSVA